MKNKRRDGITYEKAVASLQSIIDKDAIVNHNEKILDRNGHMRQFDVVIRGQLAGYKMLGVIECKDRKARVDTPIVDAFITKSRDINANFAIIASNSGFTKQALEKCKMNGIGAISLLPNESISSGFKVFTEFFAEVYSWSEMGVEITNTLDQEVVIPKEFTIQDIYLNNLSLFDWFLHFLNNEMYECKTIGWYQKNITFSTPQTLLIKGYKVPVNNIKFFAFRLRKVLHKWASLYGEGIFEWNEGKLTIPPSGTITTQVTLDFSDWEEYNEEIPEKLKELQLKLEVFLMNDDVSEEIPFDLRELSQ